jgi:hypothetical protein
MRSFVDIAIILITHHSFSKLESTHPGCSSASEENRPRLMAPLGDENKAIRE